MAEHHHDLALVERILADDPAARSALDAHVERVASRCARGASDVVDAVDLQQSLSLLLFERDARLLRSYGGRAALSTWLTAIARRQVWRALQAAQREHTLRAAIATEPTKAPADPERQTLRRETIAGVRAVLDGLPDEDRLLLTLLVEQDAPAHVVAQSLGITPDGVRMRKMRLLRRLQKRLRGWWP